MWWRKISNDSDVVVSTRIRFARNLKNYRFPNYIGKNDALKIISDLDNMINKSEYKLFRMKDIDETTRRSLIEQHLISKEFVDNTETGGLILNSDNTIVTMINEEDHLRIQCFESGLNIDKCYEKLVKFSDELELKIEFAVHEKYGYLTACPTNVGSGMRVSVMLHLPALAKLGILSKLLEEASNIGVSVRGLYGENTTGYGNMFQISNQKTLGESDNEIIYKIKGVITSIVEQERKARKVLTENSIELEDELYRTYGVIKNARMMSSEEALKLLAKLRMAAAMNIIPTIKLEKIQSLIVEVQPNTFKNIMKDELNELEENIKRAEYIRKEID
jgi:protein arginine kinase